MPDDVRRAVDFGIAANDAALNYSLFLVVSPPTLQQSAKSPLTFQC